jgi:hypothetical protein
MFEEHGFIINAAAAANAFIAANCTTDRETCKSKEVTYFEDTMSDPACDDDFHENICGHELMMNETCLVKTSSVWTAGRKREGSLDGRCCPHFEH